MADRLAGVVLLVWIVCLVSVCGCWLGAAAGWAAESIDQQWLAASVQAQVSWGSANGCVQNVQTNDFGLLTPSPTTARLEPFDATPHILASNDLAGDHIWVGCVTTNTGLAGVTAQGLHDLSSTGHVLSLADVSIGVTNAVGGMINGGSVGCGISAGQQTSDGCPLAIGGPQESLLEQADSGTTELDWQYQLDLPANQPVGSYTGGEVVLTATAGAESGAPRVSSTPTLTTTPAQGTSVGLSNVSFTGMPTPVLTYQWQDCTGTAQSSCSNIPGATSATYTPTASDQGFYLSATITATNSHGTASVSASPTAVDATYAQAVEADHPVADWTFNDLTGSSAAADSAGWGALSGGSPAFGITGPFVNSGTAMTLSSGVMSHTGTPLTSPTTFTVEIWFKATSGDIAGSFDEYIVANQEGAIWLGLASCTAKTGFLPGNCLDFVWQKPGVEPPVVQTGYRFTDTNWHYIVMSHGGDGLTHIYVDGVEYGPFNSSSIYNGYTFGTLVGGLKGSFSHYAYYNSELSSKRVAVHWQASKTS